MNKKMKVSPEGIRERFSTKKSLSPSDFNLWNDELSTAHISDALKNILEHDWVIPGVKPLKDEFKIIGRAFTVKTSANDWGTALRAIDMANEGDVLFICADKDDNAVWGELTSKTAQKKGLTGTVVYGAVRDVNAIRQLNYPVFTQTVIPNAGFPTAKGEVNVSLQCGDVVVNPNDVIIGDDCGVIVVPAELFPQIIKEALKIKKDESEIINKIDNGYTLSEILGI